MNYFFHLYFQKFYFKIFFLYRQWFICQLASIPENQMCSLDRRRHSTFKCFYLQPRFSSTFNSTHFLQYITEYFIYIIIVLVRVITSLSMHMFFFSAYKIRFRYFSNRNKKFIQSWPPWQRAQSLPQRLKCPFCPKFLQCTWTWYA
jgi:hypothetical protein